MQQAMLFDIDARIVPPSMTMPSPPPSKQQPKMRWQPSPWWWVVIALSLTWAIDLWRANNPVQAMAYSELLQHLQAGEVESLRVSGDVIEGQLKQAKPGESPRFVSTRVDPF